MKQFLKFATMKKTLLLFLLFLVQAFVSQAQIRYEIPFPQPLEHRKDTFKVFLIGDVMMHSRQMEYDHRYFLNELKAEMESSDLCVANMEFTAAGKPYSGYPCFSAPEYYPQYITDCGADVLLLANNHILDRGAEGLDRTLDFYRELCASTGALTTGIGGTPLLTGSEGWRIAFINFTYGTNGRSDSRVNYMDTSVVRNSIESAKQSGADFIIALPHWGNEYQLRHSGEQQSWAEWLVGCGVDAIVGSHPHVIQDTTHIQGVPVIYSMGNAVSNMSAPNTRLELAVTLTFTNTPQGKRMLEPELELLWCTLPGTLTGSYCTIPIKKWANRRSDWLIKSDFDNMISTAERVLRETGIDFSY